MTNVKKVCPRAPAYLGEIAKTMWKNKAPHLMQRDDVTDADWTCLELYCGAYQQYRNAVTDIDRRGFSVATSTGGEVRNPSLSARDMAEKTMIKCGDQLGFNPVSRKKTPVKMAEIDALDNL